MPDRIDELASVFGEEPLHPIVIGVFYNSTSCKYDLEINIGNFESMALAEKAAAALDRVFQDHYPGNPAAQITES